jgi:molybdate transport repressor ModE-like protein
MVDQIRTPPDWEDIRVFIALARHGSLSAAARALSVAHATIARRIQSLERAFGDKLVERRPDGYVLTAAGAQALAAASDMESAAARLVRGGPSDSVQGVVRINAPPSLMQAALVEPLAALAARYPLLDIDLSSDFRTVSLDRREADIALRLGKPADGDVVARFLVHVGYGFYASAQWAAALEAGTAAAFVGFDEANNALPEAVWLARHFPRARMPFKANGHLAQAIAARAGAGLALLPHFVGRRDAGLVRCRLAHEPPSRELWLLTRRDGRKDAATRTVTECLVQLLNDRRAQFE